MITHPKVRIHSKVLKGFKRRAWETYPNEHIECVMGVRSLDGFDIHILTPVDVIAADPSKVDYDHDLEVISETEQTTRSRFLGYIHTHIGKRTCEHLSLTDSIDALNNQELLTGVCLLYISHGKRHSIFHFEIPQPPLLLEISNI